MVKEPKTADEHFALCHNCPHDTCPKPGGRLCERGCIANMPTDASNAQLDYWVRRAAGVIEQP
jgi:hypothetical protein